MTIRVPDRGQLVYLDGAASAQFHDHPIRLRLTSPVVPSAGDVAHRRRVETAECWLLTGWQLDARGERLLHRTVSVRPAGVQILGGSAVA